ARALHAAYVRDVPLPDEGLKWGNLYVARLPAMPAVLVENAMMILPEQEVLLSDLAFRGRLAGAVVSGLKAFALEACVHRPPPPLPPKPVPKPAPKEKKHAPSPKSRVVHPARR
ncbi:MAG: N-acetylmuramoyl-L-alanine amidase, partial [Elusimicrobia bacterium]|nr:N-acetylmuramoyl-L-alanine amidase [Elusimicrobiota bacterium]